MFNINEIAILNNNAINGLPDRIGERVIIRNNVKSPNYDYSVLFDDGSISKVKEKELSKLTNADKKYMCYIFIGNKVIYEHTYEEVEIIKVDYINRQVEIKDKNNLESLVGFNSIMPLTMGVFDNIQSIHNKENKLGKFGEIGLDIGKFTDGKDQQYGSSVDATLKMTEVLMERYIYDEENYLIPKSLLRHLLLQVRIMDKQNRIFNNPSGKNEKESPYRDITGYGLIGVNMVENK